MLSSSPTLEGFRAAFRRPSLSLAEIAWRWTVGALAAALFLFAFLEFIDSLTVASSDAVLLRSRQPLLVGRALAHILHGSMSRAAFATLFAAIALSALWIVAASLGRAITVNALLDYFRSGGDRAVSRVLHDSFRTYRSLTGLNFLRVALALAALLAFIGASIVAGFASPDKNPQPGLAANVFMLLAAMIWGAWFGLNWLLSLAGIFIVRDGEDAIGSLSAAVAFVRLRSTAVATVSACTGLAHLVASCFAVAAVSFPLAFVHIAPRPAIAIAAVLTLVYLAFVDWLFTARLAGYISILETSENVSRPARSPVPSPAAGVDRDELILGDIPAHPAET